MIRKNEQVKESKCIFKGTQRSDWRLLETEIHIYIYIRSFKGFSHDKNILFFKISYKFYKTVKSPTPHKISNKKKWIRINYTNLFLFVIILLSYVSALYVCHQSPK